MSNYKNDGPDSRDLRTIEKLERDWELKKEKGEKAQKDLEEELRKFFREQRAQLAREALENLSKAPGRNPFDVYKKGLDINGDSGMFGGHVSGKDRLGEDE